MVAEKPPRRAGAARRSRSACSGESARPRRANATPPIALGIDVGGTGIKGALVDLHTGALLTERHRLKTPQPASPKAVIEAMRELVAAISAEHPFSRDIPLGVGMPAVVIDGITATAVNIDEGWLGYAAESEISAALGHRVRVLNDADAAGLGEMRFGAGKGKAGTVAMITLGTGIGSALFRDGHLLPNTELGHIEVRGKDAEERASAVARERRKLSWSEYAEELDEYLHKLDMLVWPDLLILGGGISKEADRFLERLTVRPPVVAAVLRNNAGIVGAALFAAEGAARH